MDRYEASLYRITLAIAERKFELKDGEMWVGKKRFMIWIDKGTGEVFIVLNDKRLYFNGKAERCEI